MGPVGYSLLVGVGLIDDSGAAMALSLSVASLIPVVNPIATILLIAPYRLAVVDGVKCILRAVISKVYRRDGGCQITPLSTALRSTAE